MHSWRRRRVSVIPTPPNTLILVCKSQTLCFTGGCTIKLIIYAYTPLKKSSGTNLGVGMKALAENWICQLWTHLKFLVDASQVPRDRIPGHRYNHMPETVTPWNIYLTTVNNIATDGYSKPPGDDGNQSRSTLSIPAAPRKVRYGSPNLSRKFVFHR